VAFSYAVVEITFDVGLLITARRHWPNSPSEATARRRSFAWWTRLWYESTGILVVDLMPTISGVIGVTILGHVAGAVAVAAYGIAARLGNLVGSFIMPFTDSLFVSLCRGNSHAKGAMTGMMMRLSIVALAVGTTASFALVAAGPKGLELFFGSGYGSAVWPALVLILAGTVRSTYRPFLRRIQSENGIGFLRFWFVASMAIQVPLVLFAAARWSSTGAAMAVLTCALLFEAIPTARKFSAHRRMLETVNKLVIAQMLAAVCLACFALILAWGRQRAGGLAASVAALATISTGLLVVRQVIKYMAAARLIRTSSLSPSRTEER